MLEKGSSQVKKNIKYDNLADLVRGKINFFNICSRNCERNGSIKDKSLSFIFNIILKQIEYEILY